LKSSKNSLPDEVLLKIGVAPKALSEKDRANDARTKPRLAMASPKQRRNGKDLI
jgi:hypothetical protein